MIFCEACNIEHDGTYGSGRFCTVKCARSFSTKNKRDEISLKVSNKLLKQRKTLPTILECENCHLKFETFKNRNRKFCGHSCANKFNSLKNRQELSNRMNIRYKSGDLSIGWQSRNKLSRSYPEKFFEELFTKRNIIVEIEVKIGKYFADFKVGNYILEIDGQQHKRDIDRIKNDLLKDEYLKSLGYSVYRIDWKSPKHNKENLNYLINEFQNFIKQFALVVQ